AADPRADGDAHHVASPARGTLPPLANCRAVGVVVERGGQPEPLRHAIAQREIPPAKIRRDDHQPALAIQWSRRPDANAEEILPLTVRLGDRVKDHAFDESYNAIGDS